MSKVTSSGHGHFAKAGGVVTSWSSFMKTPDPFRTDYGKQDYSGKDAARAGSKAAPDNNKVEKTVKPRS